MERHPPLDDLSVEELVKLEGDVDETLCLILKIDAYSATKGIQQRLTALLTKAWRATARKALLQPLDRLLSGKLSSGRIDTFLHSLGVGLSKPLTPAQQTVAGERLKSIWDRTKRVSSTEMKVKPVWSYVDQDAVKAINRQQVFWINGFYDDHLSTRIRAVTREVVLESGLSYQEAGRELHRTLIQEFGLGAAPGKSKYAINVPARYAGNPKAYCDALSSTVAHEARIFSRLGTFAAAGVVTYSLLNPNDERTGQICFAAGAPVLMADGSEKAIEDVRSGDVVVTGTGKHRRVRETTWRRAASWLSFGGRFTITPEHAIMTSDGWKPAKEVAGDGACRVRVHQLRFGNVVLPEPGAAAPVLFSGVLPRASSEGALGRANMPALRPDLQGPTGGSGARPAPALLDGVPARGGAQRTDARRAVGAVRAMPQAVPQEAGRGAVRQDAEVLLQGVSRHVGREGVLDVRRDVQAVGRARAVLLGGMLPQESSGDAAGVSGTRRAARAVAAVRGRGAGWARVGRLRRGWPSGVGGRRGVLAPHAAGRQPGEAGGSEAARAGSGARERRGLAPRPAAGGGSGAAHRFGWARLRPPVVLSLDLVAYNLELDGDDPTYVVSGIVVHNCKEMHGQTFSVNVASTHMDRILNASSPEDVKKIQPWLSGSQLRNALGDSPRGSLEARHALVAAGAILPPFHAHCRTDIVVTSLR